MNKADVKNKQTKGCLLTYTSYEEEETLSSKNPYQVLFKELLVHENNRGTMLSSNHRFKKLPWHIFSENSVL